MKKVIFMICTSLISSAIFATPANNIPMNPLKMVRLSDIQSNTITITEAYPGPSHACNLIMRSNMTSIDLTKQFTQRFQFTHVYSQDRINYDVDGSGQLLFKLMPDAYEDGVTITTLDGQSIASNVASVFPSSTEVDVGMLLGMC